MEPYESVRMRKDGTLLDVSLTVSPIKDASGKIIGASKIARDITQRKQAEAERARLAAVLEKSLNEIYIFDTTQLRFQYVNEGALRNLGYSMEAMREMTPLSISSRNSPRRDSARWSRRCSAGKRRSSFSTPCTAAPTAAFIPVEVHLQCVAHAGEDVFMAVILDITERRKGEEERERLLASAAARPGRGRRGGKPRAFPRRGKREPGLHARLRGHARQCRAGRRAGHRGLVRRAHAEADGTVRVVATAHADPAKLAIAKELQERYPEDTGSPFGTPSVLRTGQSLLHTQIPDDAARGQLRAMPNISR